MTTFIRVGFATPVLVAVLRTRLFSGVSTYARVTFILGGPTAIIAVAIHTILETWGLMIGLPFVTNPVTTCIRLYTILLAVPVILEIRVANTIAAYRAVRRAPTRIIFHVVAFTVTTIGAILVAERQIVVFAPLIRALPIAAIAAISRTRSRMLQTTVADPVATITAHGAIFTLAFSALTGGVIVVAG